MENDGNARRWPDTRHPKKLIGTTDVIWARLLLTDAVHRSWKNTGEVASSGVVVEAYDEADRSFYLHYEFLELAGHSNKLFIAMTPGLVDVETIERAI
jgi:hypothetical protein